MFNSKDDKNWHSFIKNNVRKVTFGTLSIYIQIIH